MYTGVFDYLTLAIYLLVGITGMLLMQRVLVTSTKTVFGKRNDYRIFGALFVLIFVIFAVIRKVDYKVGGADALNYKNGFLESLFVPIPDNLLTVEILYEWLERAVRFFTDNYRVHFFICYFLIASSYLAFVGTYGRKDKLSAIPFVLMVFPYLKGFCTLKSSLAVAFFLFGLCAFKRNKLIGTVLILSTFFIHRMSILYILFLLFYLVFKKGMSKLSGRQLFVLTVALVVGVYLVALFVRDQLIDLKILTGTDGWYLKRSVGVSIFRRWPMLIAHVFLAIAMIFSNKKISKSQEMDFVKFLCIFDFVAMPVSIALGFWRANEYLYMARLVMWGHLIYVNTEHLSRRWKFIIKAGVFVVFVAWLIFRIYSEWDDLKIMPYVVG